MQQFLYEQKVKTAPTSPGCYIWKDKDKKILYIGKAVNIRKRASSYYLNYERLDPKIRLMVDQVDDVEFYEVDSEVEALILETNLIKKYRPKYNKLMKDDKNYIWLMIDWYRDFPSIKIVREKLDKKSEYYGPFPQKFPVSKVLASLRKIYPYCDNLVMAQGSMFHIMSKPCFNYHLGLCSGVCAGLVGKRVHRKNINGIRSFFKGKKSQEIERIKLDMQKLAKRKEFEKAAKMRDKLNDLEYVTQRIKIDRGIDEELLEKVKLKANEKALVQLINALKEISNIPSTTITVKTKNTTNNIIPENAHRSSLSVHRFRIECYDISNISGTNAVGSMVVFIDGKSEKSLYRKFKIRTRNTPDDFAMMKEILGRRLKKIQVTQTHSKNQRISKSKIQNSKSGDWNTPNIIIVDGGKGQLSSAYEVLKKTGYIDTIVLVGLAKKEEEIYYVKNEIPGGLDFGKIVLPRRSDALFLVQRIRDEAHRFAIGYHRNLRSKSLAHSILDDIPGVGEVTKRKLLLAFGSVINLRKKTSAEISSVIRNKATAQAICKILQIES